MAPTGVNEAQNTARYPFQHLILSSLSQQHVIASVEFGMSAVLLSVTSSLLPLFLLLFPLFLPLCESWLFLLSHSYACPVGNYDTPLVSVSAIMGDALCGPSNPLQNFQKHASVDRTLQQDRLTSRQSPSLVRSLGPRVPSYPQS